MDEIEKYIQGFSIFFKNNMEIIRGKYGIYYSLISEHNDA
jgi:hypothetical protein